MTLELGIKSDPIEYRYSFDWLFNLMDRLDVRHMQLGSYFELYQLPDVYFTELRRRAADSGIRISSCFTAHRELGGFYTGNAHLERVARRNYERLIRIGGIVGADYVGSNPGAVYRDRPQDKAGGIACYLRHMRELQHIAAEEGLSGLTLEPMSSQFEPPSLPHEIDHMMDTLNASGMGASGMGARGTNASGAGRPATVPAYVCGDVSHGVADADGNVVHSNIDLFKHAIPHMAEFHFKNTDERFDSTFGFTADERARGIVDPAEIVRIARTNMDRWPVERVVGYLEIGGPKLGRDYSDPLLDGMLAESVSYLKKLVDPATFRPGVNSVP